MGNARSAGLRLQNNGTIHAEEMVGNKSVDLRATNRRSLSLSENVNLDDSQIQYFITRPQLGRNQSQSSAQSFSIVRPDQTPQSNLIDMDVSSRDFGSYAERAQVNAGSSPRSAESSVHKSLKKLTINTSNKSLRSRRAVSPEKRGQVPSIAEDPHFEEVQSEMDERPDIVEKAISLPENEPEELPKIIALDEIASREPTEADQPVSQMGELKYLTGKDEVTNFVREYLTHQLNKYGVFSYESAKDGNNTELSFKSPIQDSSNSKIYFGEWKDGKKHGRGILIWPDGSFYQGSWEDNKRNGKGRYITIKGTMYEGNWKDDKMHGKGKCSYASGSVYDGEWAEDLKHGYGCEIYANGTRYEGDFADNTKSGVGKQQWKDGSVYTGGFEDNTMNGEGTLQWGDGRKYTGSWVKDKMEGEGEFLWPDGRKYHGSYKNDMKDGYGEFEWPNTEKYKGGFAFNKMHGEGVYTKLSGETLVGVWKQGKLTQAKKDKDEEQKFEVVVDSKV